MKKDKERKPHKGRIIKSILIITFLNITIILGILFGPQLFIKKTNYKPIYIASNESEVPIYDYEYNEVFKLYRGTLLNSFLDSITYNDIKYRQVIYDGEKYLIKEDNTVENYNDSVTESVLYVRTPVTVYKEDNSPKILGFLPKGSEIAVNGFDKLDKGLVNMYKIKYNDEDGYIYSKYLVDSKEKSLENYNVNNTYDIHKDRTFYYELYGGNPAKLDYYPYNKPSFDDNELLNEAKTLYLNANAYVLDNIDSYIEIAKDSTINAFVVDIKDGYLAYKSDVAKTYSISSYESAPRDIDEYKNVIQKLKDNGFYVIGRIVAFNDSHFASDNPSEAILENCNPSSWTSAYSRKAWEYNVSLAIEAITLFEFNEIQFDYVRFPEESYSMSTSDEYDFRNSYNEGKVEAIQNFIFYATDQIHKNKAYISVDVFGEAANDYVTAYGQYWPAISNIVDVISAMPYPDHFNKYDYGFGQPVWEVPYNLMCAWGSSASERQKEIPTPALVRTWIQAYDAIYYPYVVYDADKVSDEIQGLYDTGLNNGYITWNGSSNIDKYRSLKEAFRKEYR